MAEFENDQEQENIVQKSEVATNENDTTSEAALSEYGPNGFSLSTTQLAADESPTNKKLYQFQETADASKTDSISTLKEIQLKAQQKATNYYSNTSGVTQFKENKTGLPNKLKSGVENLSGQSLDDVKVHRNSDKPAQLEAHAYAQGNDIHLGPGKEKHLPHEAWHVAQQKQGRVKPTIQKKGVKINDSEALEKEADQMGAKAMNFSSTSDESYQLKEANQTNLSTSQLAVSSNTTVQLEGDEAEDTEVSEKLELKEKVGAASKVKDELTTLKDQGDAISTNAQTLQNPDKETVGPSALIQTAMDKMFGKVAAGIISSITSIASSFTAAFNSLRAMISKFNAFLNLNKSEGDGVISEIDENKKIKTYTIDKLFKGFLKEGASFATNVLDFINSILKLVPDVLTQAASLAITIFQTIVSGLKTLVTTPKRWMQWMRSLPGGQGNKKDINSEEVCKKAFEQKDDAAIEFLWALELPSVRGSGIASIDSLATRLEDLQRQGQNVMINSVNRFLNTDIEPDENNVQNIAKEISDKVNKDAGIDGLAAFTLLIKDEVLNDGSKARIQDEVKEQMTGFGV